MVQLSVVVPVFDEAEVLPMFAGRLRGVLDDLGTSYEVVAVDDGSTDATPVLLERQRRDWPQLRIVRLRVNAGHQAALTAGLVRARGDYVATIDADLQDPPESLAAMLRTALDSGVDVVYGVRSDRASDSAFKRMSAQWYYRIMRRLAGVKVRENAGDYRLMSRAAVAAVNSLPEQHRVLRLAVPALGFPSADVEYRREVRPAGRSKYPLSKMLRLSLDSVTGFSIAPLRVATWAGLLGGLVTMLLGIYAIVTWATGHAIQGWTSVFVAVAAVGTVQLLCLGMLGEYVGRMYTSAQGRPSYFVAHDSLDVEERARAPLE